MLDAGLQIFAAAAIQGDRPELHLPTHIGGLRFTLGRVAPCGATRAWSIGKGMPRSAMCGYSTTKAMRRRSFTEFALSRSTTRRSSPPWTNTTNGSMSSSGGPGSAPRRPRPGRGRTAWLVFADRSGVGDALSALLVARGEPFILVAPGDSFEQMDGEHFRIRPGAPEDIARLFEALSRSHRSRRHNIVHLWNSIPTRRRRPRWPRSAPPRPTAAAMCCLSHRNWRGPIFATPSRLWLVTRGAQAVGDELAAISVAQSPLWGFGRVIAQEHPTMWGGLVDLEAGDSSPGLAARQLAGEIADGDGEDQLAFRHGHRFVGRLVRHRPPEARYRPAMAPGWRRSDQRRIGRPRAFGPRWTVEQGARRLILVGRTASRNARPGIPLRRKPPGLPDRRYSGDRITRRSADAAAVDVADEAALAGFLADYRAEGWPAIRGVVHAAGVRGRSGGSTRCVRT